MADPRTTKVVMMVAISGTRDGGDWPGIGGEIVVPKAEADSLIQQKQAVTPAQWAKARQKRG